MIDTLELIFIIFLIVYAIWHCSNESTDIEKLEKRIFALEVKFNAKN